MATFILIGLLAIIAYELFIFIKYPPGIWPNAGNTVKRQVSEETAEEDCAIIGHSTFNMSDQLRRMEVRQAEEERKSAVVRGEMTEVTTKYTMFNKKGYPIRGTVTIQIRQGDGSAEAKESAADGTVENKK